MEGRRAAGRKTCLPAATLAQPAADGAARAGQLASQEARKRRGLWVTGEPGVDGNKKMMFNFKI
jgi:hypothetical protein